MNKKIKLLVWADSPTASTGFGTVSKHILRHLYNTDKYEIDMVGINYYGDFYNKEEFPYQISPARLLDPADPYGHKQLYRALQRGDYDLLFIINDTFVVSGAAEALEKIKADRLARNQKTFKTIFYYPVDCAIVPEMSKMINYADVIVTYTQWAKKETEQKLPALNKPIHVIYHGCDTSNFRPISQAERDQWRARYLAIIQKDTFLFLNVNRNSVRKDIPKSILAFKEFKKFNPNSMMYIHCAARDNNIDLIQTCNSLGLSTSKDVVFPAMFNLADGGFPIDVLNNFYNAADAFITTTLGEGWGLSITEAMSAKVPVIAPNNTSIPEILGTDKDRGYLYECKDKTWIDNSGFRPVGRTEDIVAKMVEAYKGKTTTTPQIVERANTFVQGNTWPGICKQWVKLFDETVNEKVATDKVRSVLVEEA